MENIVREPIWFANWRSKAKETAKTLPAYVIYGEGARGIDFGTPAFDGASSEYRVAHIDKELELYTLKEALETIGINDLLEGLLTSPLLPEPTTAIDADGRARISSGLLCYAQPMIDASGALLEQTLAIETTHGAGTSADLFVVIAKTGARLRIHQEVLGGDSSTIAHHMIVILAEDGAEVLVEESVGEAKGAMLVEHIGIIAGHASVSWKEEVSAGLQYRSFDRNILVGADARATVTHVLLAQVGARFEVDACTDVRAGEGKVDLLAVGAAGSEGHILYRGEIVCGSLAGGTIANENARFVLLDDSGRVEAIPAVRAEEHTVEVSHRSAITHIDDEELFYAESRGLGKDEARSVALSGFFAEAKPTRRFLDRLRAKIS